MEILYSYVCFGPLRQAQSPMLSRSSEKYISFILPAYNEEARLSITLDEMLGYGFLDLILHFHVMFLRKCFCCCNNFAVVQVTTSLDEQQQLACMRLEVWHYDDCLLMLYSYLQERAGRNKSFTYEVLPSLNLLTGIEILNTTDHLHKVTRSEFHLRT